MKEEYNYISLHSELLTKDELNSIQSRCGKILRSVGGTEIAPLAIDQPEILLYFILSGGAEQIFLEQYKKRREIFPDDPVYLIAHSGNNSLPASLEILAKIKQEGLKGKIIYLSGNEQNDLELLRSSVRNLKVYKKLLGTKIGLIGKPSDWLVASSPDISLVKNTWGIAVKEFDFETLKEIYHSVTDSDIQNNLIEFKNNARTIFEPTETDLKNSVKVYSAIKKISEENDLNSLSVRCFDILTSDGTTGCFALSQLTDNGIIAGCEGDLVSTIAMLWAHLLCGQSSWMANPARINMNENLLLLAHCTVPREMVSEYTIRSHFESGKGVGIQGKMIVGPVTLIRLGGANLKSLWLAEGEIIGNSSENNLCRTQVEIRLHDRNKLKELLNNPLGNHLVLVHGFHAEALEEWHNEFIL